MAWAKLESPEMLSASRTPVRHGQALEQFLGAFVDVKHPQLQVEHRLARHAEKEMPRLNDARVDRADRHLEHAFALDLAELVARAA